MNRRTLLKLLGLGALAPTVLAETPAVPRAALPKLAARAPVSMTTNADFISYADDEPLTIYEGRLSLRNENPELFDQVTDSGKWKGRSP